jgi:hypothetical protein
VLRSPFMRSSYNMLSTMQDDGAKTMKAEMEKNALSHVERRRGNLFKNGVPRPPPTGEMCARFVRGGGEMCV